MFSRFRGLSRLRTHASQRETEVSNQWVHLKRSRQRQPVTSVLLGGVDVRRVASNRDLSEQAECPGFMPSFIVILRERERSAAGSECVLRPSGSQVAFAQINQEQRRTAYKPHASGPLD